MKVGFIGSFNKNYNHRDCDYGKKLGMDFEFNEDLYQKVEKKIKAVLGEKKLYSVQDVYKYFHKEFYAFPIDYRSYYNYCNTAHVYVSQGIYNRSTITDDKDIESLTDLSGEFYSYFKDNKFTNETATTFVIDVSNDALQTKYSDIATCIASQEARLMKEFGKIEKSDRGYIAKTSQQEFEVGELVNNIIIVVGSFDKEKINSIKVLQGEGIVEDIEYAIEFFRRNS